MFKARWGETVVPTGSASYSCWRSSRWGWSPESWRSAHRRQRSSSEPYSGGCLITLSGALGSVVNVALYHYAVDGTALGGFTEADLAHQFKPR